VAASLFLPDSGLPNEGEPAMRRTLRHTPFRPQFLGLAALALTGLVGCRHGHNVGHVVGHPTGPLVLAEVEPNDSPFDATFSDELDATTHLVIDGYVQRAPGFDVQDHHPFLALEPMIVEFYLAGDGQLADLDLSVWDDDLGTYVLTYQSPFDPEKGAFTVLSSGTLFQLAVTSPFEDAYYTLEIVTYPMHFASPEAVSPATSEGSDSSAFETQPTGFEIESTTLPIRGKTQTASVSEDGARGAIRPLPAGSTVD
tara:strand:- start:42 stop:806 length:765 start_codon:yes stop_codon:yes gene_type:complete